jgi:hypothetical protein
VVSGPIYQQAPSTSALVEAGAPPWAQRLGLKMIQMFQLKQPIAPTQLWVTDKASLPDPEKWHGCLVAVRDQNCLVVAQGASWLKITVGGPV